MNTFTPQLTLFFRAFILACVVVVGWPIQSEAYHIAGAELTYECIGNNEYRVRLTLFRDCSFDNSDLPVAGFDDPVWLYIFTGGPATAGGGQVYQTIPIGRPNNTPGVNPPDIDNCGGVPPEVCLQEGVYETVITLPPRAGGYDLAWTRCCRNLTIDNVLSPDDQGITFLAHVPGTNEATNVCNSMPEFNDYVPLFLCLDKTLIFDHSATDPDGDSLVYALTNPYSGLNNQFLGSTQANPAVGPPGPGSPNNPMGAPPYQNVPFNVGFDFQNPFGVSSQCEIDPQTGVLTITPQQIGLFVFSVSVFEYRNGVLLSENRRDFQIYVLPCEQITDLPVITTDLSPLDSDPFTSYSPNGDTIYATANAEFCFNAQISDPEPDANLSAVESFPPGTDFTKNQPAGNQIDYEICYTPSCNDPGAVIPIALEGQDPEDCNYFNQVYDTLWIVVQVPPSYGAEVSTDLAGNTLEGDDTVVVVLEEDTVCWDFTVRSPGSSTDSLQWEIIPPPGVGANVPTVSNLVAQGDSITGTACWPAACVEGTDPVPMRVRAVRENQCPPDSTAEDTFWVRVVLPPNPSPEVTHLFADTSLRTSGDTLFVYPDENPCIDFLITDSVPFSRLRTSPQVIIEDPVTGQVLSPQPTVGAGSQQPSIPEQVVYQGQFCWEVPCAFIGQPLRVRLIAQDSSVCGLEHEVEHTFTVLIQEPPNPAPTLTTDLSGISHVSQDTVFTFADSSFCYSFQVLDSMPASQLFADVRIERLSGNPYNGPLPQLSIDPGNPDTLLSGQVCFTPDCEAFNDTLLLILRATDSIACVESHIEEDTVYLIVSEPVNYPPTFTVSYQGAPAPDTVSLIGEEDLCFGFELRDTLPDAQFGDHLSLETELSTLAGTPIPNSFSIDTLTADSVLVLSGSVCWNADCDLINQTLLLTLTGVDSATCTRSHALQRQVYIQVLPQPTEPIFISLENEEMEVRGDTLVFHPKQGFCATIRLTDSLNGGNLLLEGLGDIFGQNGYNGPVATISQTTGQGEIVAEFCWQPSCQELNTGLWPITFRGTSTIYCANPETVDTTVWILLEEPENNPPSISVSNLPAEVQPGEEACFSVRVEDPDPFAELSLEGLGEVFETNFDFGGALRIVDTSFTQEPFPLLSAEVCFQPNCYSRRKTYEITFRAQDNTNCDTTLVTEAAYSVQINDCGIKMPNVFTPNGDGINDGFGPAVEESVARYKMYISDRWGNRVFATESSQRWNGTVNGGNDAAEGVYFYVIEYIFESGNGPLLQDQQTGQVTLLR